MVSIVMGVDQHRAQISAEWLDMITGEISRARIAPADRAGVRKFPGSVPGRGVGGGAGGNHGVAVRGQELERIGAEVHLAEPAEAAALKGKKKRARTDLGRRAASA